MKNKNTSGFSLFEIMVVIVIFALLGVLVTQSLALSIRGSKKSETMSKTRSSLSYAMGIIERQLRNANSVTDCGVDLEANTEVNYVDEFGVVADFGCVGGEGVASTSASVTTPLITAGGGITLTGCSFECTPLNEEGVPDTVTVKLEGGDPNYKGAEASQVTIESKIMLRNY